MEVEKPHMVRKESLFEEGVCPPPLDDNVLAALYKGIADAIVVIEVNSRCVVYWNDGASALFGYQAQEILQQTTERLYADRSSFERIYQMAAPQIEQSGFWRGQWQYCRRDGSTFAAEVTSSLLQTEKGSYLVKVIREVKEGKDAQQIIFELNQQLAQRVMEQSSELVSKSEELQQEEAQRRQVEQILGNLLRNITNYAVLITDASGRVVDWNRTATRILGYEGYDLLEQRLSLFFVGREGQQEERIQKALDEAMQHGTYRDYQMLVRKDGTGFYARVVIFALRDDANGLQGFLILLRDDSQERSLREKLREKEHLAAIGTAASMLAHEIGNPLNGISTTVQLLERFMSRDGNKAPEHMLSTLKDLKSEIDRLTGLLNEFKTIARPQKLALQPVKLEQLIQETIALVKTEGKEIEIVSDCPSDLPAIRGDSEKLRQALFNLLKNAVEAMPYGGKLTIKGYPSDNVICVDVIDTGMGIPEDLKVFDLFSSTKPHGTGLGLFIVQQIVLAHDGTIAYSSAVGQGTTFHLSLPSGVSSHTP